MDPNYSFEKLDTIVNKIIDKHAPLKRLSKKDLKLQAKPWITPGITTSIKRRGKLLRQFIKANQPDHKDELHRQYKCVRNRIVALTRLSKKNHFQRYFEENSYNIRKTWTGIKISTNRIRRTAPPNADNAVEGLIQY